MTATWSILLGVILLSGPDEREVVSDQAARIAEEADAGYAVAPQAGTSEESACVTSRRSDFDRKAGVVMFEGNVVVSYSKDFVMCADRLFMFMARSNEVSRVVALGNVSITNEARVGTCEMATYRRNLGEIEMFGGEAGKVARLDEGGETKGSVEGVRIRFWIDSEQVEVERSRISTEQREGIKVL